ncbi:carbohydrate porin [Terriglobus tenax]|uniref:carbohydrate porin n=1 Tax=Terriglobus tenax TaxID=1111115 RepID=UPI0021DFA9EC|nr:carbohydrate porin [Terriglobus tenax]
MPALLAVTLCGACFAQAAQQESAPVQSQRMMPVQQTPPHAAFVQEMDSDAQAQKDIPADPLFQADPLQPVLGPLNGGLHQLSARYRLTVGAAYTLLSQYSHNVVPEAPRHQQFSGRLDFNGSWVFHQKGGNRGSLNFLVRSGTNIGTSQQWDLSDAVGAANFIQCLQATGPQRPITLNLLYWRQDMLNGRLALYVGKIHPNDFMGLSPVNNDETRQFLAGTYDGNFANPYSGAYSSGGALAYQLNRKWYAHLVTVDTEGTAYTGPQTIAHGHFYEGLEVGYKNGVLGKGDQIYRVGVWRDDTKNRGSGYGVYGEVDHEFRAWVVFGRMGVAPSRGTTAKHTEGLGFAHIRPFGRRGDMFGAAFSSVSPQDTSKRMEQLYEMFYRARINRSTEFGPDFQIVIDPANDRRLDGTVVMGFRLRVVL